MKKHLSTILFILCCLAVGGIMGKGILHFFPGVNDWLHGGNKSGHDFTHSEGPPLITGQGDAPVHRGFTIHAAELANLPAYIKENQKVFGTTVGIRYDATISRETLATAVETAHRSHMTVTLLPPAKFSPQNPFPKPLAEVAADAQAAHVDALCFSWLNTPPNHAYWMEELRKAKMAFQGNLILGATFDVMPTVDFLDVPDLLGAIGPFPLPKRLPDAPDAVNVRDMRSSWDCLLSTLESLARINKKKLAILDANVPPAVCIRYPAAGATEAPEKNPVLQQTIYQALLLETKGRDKDTDMMLFSWGSPGQLDAPNNIPTMLPKIAEAWDPSKPKPAEILDAAPADATDDVMDVPDSQANAQ